MQRGVHHGFKSHDTGCYIALIVGKGKIPLDLMVRVFIDGEPNMDTGIFSRHLSKRGINPKPGHKAGQTDLFPGFPDGEGANVAITSIPFSEIPEIAVMA